MAEFCTAIILKFPIFAILGDVKNIAAIYVILMEVSNVANKYAARKMFDEGVAAYIKKDFKTSVDLFSRAIRYDPSLALF